MQGVGRGTKERKRERRRRRKTEEKSHTNPPYETKHTQKTNLSTHPPADPASDYAAIRKELALYNPDYLSRPHVVALNKADLFFARSEDVTSGVDTRGGGARNETIDLEASPPLPELAGQITRAAAAVFEEAVLGQREGDDDSDGEEEEEEERERPAAAAASAASAASSLPHAVVWTSADSDLGLEALRAALSSALASTAGQPAPGGAAARSSSQRRAAERKERRAAALAEFEASESRRGKDYAPEELEW